MLKLPPCRAGTSEAPKSSVEFAEIVNLAVAGSGLRAEGWGPSEAESDCD